MIRRWVEGQESDERCDCQQLLNNGRHGKDIRRSRIAASILEKERKIIEIMERVKGLLEKKP